MADIKIVIAADANNPNVGDLFLDGQPAVTAIAFGSDGLDLPQAAIDVLSVVGFPAIGFFYVAIPVLGPQKVNYTGISGSQFTGCTGGEGTLVTGQAVTCYQGTVRLTANLSEEVAQEILIRLRFFLGEWFLDTTQGTPYFQSILGQKNSLAVVTQILRSVVSQTPGVANVLSFSTSLLVRALQVSFVVRLNDGQILSSNDFLNNPFVVPLNPAPPITGTGS